MLFIAEVGCKIVGFEIISSSLHQNGFVKNVKKVRIYGVQSYIDDLIANEKALGRSVVVYVYPVYEGEKSNGNLR